MYQENGTRAFLAKHATPDLMQYIHVLAQQQDGSKLEEHHRKQLAAHAEEVVKEKTKRQKKREKKAEDKAREINNMPWVENESEVDQMTVPAIRMQLEKYQSRIADISPRSEVNKLKKSGLTAALKKVISQYNSSLPLNAHNETQSEQSILRIEDPTLIDGLLVPQLKEQLELYRSHADNVPEKSEIER